MTFFSPSALRLSLDLLSLGAEADFPEQLCQTLLAMPEVLAVRLRCQDVMIEQGSWSKETEAVLTLCATEEPQGLGCALDLCLHPMTHFFSDPERDYLAQLAESMLITWLQHEQERISRKVEQETLYEALHNLRQTQEQLIHSEKLAALGGLVAGMAHELNTPLGVNITAASTLMNDFRALKTALHSGTLSEASLASGFEDLQEACQIVLKQSERAARLVKSFKQISADQSYEVKQQIVLKEYLEDIFSSLRSAFSKQQVDIKIVCDEKLKLRSFPGSLAQIITQLSLNSLQHAFVGSGPHCITVSVAYVQRSQEAGINALLSLMDQRLNSGLSPESGKTEKVQMSQDLPQLCLRFEDNGIGIQEALQTRLFEPFVTSKKSTHTGLGLHMVYNWVNHKLEGDIVYKPLNSGSAFEILLPCNLDDFSS